MNPSDPGEMTAKTRPERLDSGLLGFLRAVAPIAVVAGAAGSVGLTVWFGHRNPSRLLIALFVIWVLSPFVALLLANMVSRRWSAMTQATLHGVMLLVTLGSLAIYADVALGPPRSTPAFVFLVVPLGSWLAITIVVTIAVFVSRARGV